LLRRSCWEADAEAEEELQHDAELAQQAASQAHLAPRSRTAHRACCTAAASARLAVRRLPVPLRPRPSEAWEDAAPAGQPHDGKAAHVEGGAARPRTRGRSMSVSDAAAQARRWGQTRASFGSSWRGAAAFIFALRQQRCASEAAPSHSTCSQRASALGRLRHRSEVGRRCGRSRMPQRAAEERARGRRSTRHRAPNFADQETLRLQGAGSRQLKRASEVPRPALDAES
jgi:hypothetical protein